MSLLKKIPMGLSLLSARLRGKPMPFMVNWAITGRCNLRCKHCYGSYGILQREELTLDVFRKAIDDFKAMGTRRFTLEGGEPLMHRNFREIVGHLHSRGMEISLCTNGLLLGEHIDFLKDKVDLVVISMDGTEEHNDLIRGKGTYRKAVAAIESLKAKGMRSLIFTCLMEGNLGQVDDMVNVARQLGTNITFNIAVAKLAGADRRDPLAKAADAQYREAIRKILAHKKSGAPIFYSENNYRQAVNWPSFQQERLTPAEQAQCPDESRRCMIPCSAGRYFCYVECTGEVYPCYQTVGTLKVKNLAEVGAAEAFRHLSTLDHCQYCYNLTLSELNLQSRLDPQSVLRVIRNYGSR
jgi:MoaA/NifB/PqqE/SkfB family radical SAM enzyme